MNTKEILAMSKRRDSINSNHSFTVNERCCCVNGAVDTGKDVTAGEKLEKQPYQWGGEVHFIDLYARLIIPISYFSFLAWFFLHYHTHKHGRPTPEHVL